MKRGIVAMAVAVAVGLLDRQRRELDLARASVVLRDRLLNASFGDDDGFDVQAGHELDVVESEYVGRIDHRERERGADARQGKHKVLLRNFLRDEAKSG